METNKEIKRRVINFVAQGKGGVGKSVLTYLAGNLVFRKDIDLKIYDGDSKTATTKGSCSFLEDKLDTANFYGSDESIDRNKLLEFLTTVSQEAKGRNFWVDMGSPISEQLPIFLQSVDLKGLDDILGEMKITLNILVVLCGGDMWETTYAYYRDVHEAFVQNKLSNIILKPTFNEFRGKAINYIKKVKEFNLIDVLKFDISNATTESVINTFTETINKGTPLDKLPPLQKITYNKKLKELKEDLVNHEIIII